ncbi:MAG: hypothetical protein ACREHG_10510, partial [Candidatus Saccharimonadales bacterium]
GQKMQIVEQVEQKLTQDMEEPNTLAATMDVVDRKTLCRYKAVVANRQATPKRLKVAKTRKRQDGGGRHPILTAEQDKQLLEWVLALRQQRERVSIKHLKEEAIRLYRTQGEQSRQFNASYHWAQQWMKRQGLSMRLRTTTKDVHTPALESAAEDFRVNNKHIWSKYKDIKIWNMDETAVYLDAPGNRTIDLIGAPTVEIATTKHEKDRVTVVLCVSNDGEKKAPLVILRSKDESKLNTVKHTQVTYDNGQSTMEMYAAYNQKAYMNSKLMCEWMKHVFKPPAPPNTIPVSIDGYETVLLLDNVKSHITLSVLECFRENKVYALFLPPNCTPLVQPLDHSLNAVFKRFYEEQWRIWYHNVSHTKLTPKGNRKKADNDMIMTWIAAAVTGSLTKDHIIKCFAHTLNGDKVMEKAEQAYTERQKALVVAQTVLATASSAREAVDSALESVLNVCNGISSRSQQQHGAAL